MAPAAADTVLAKRQRRLGDPARDAPPYRDTRALYCPTDQGRLLTRLATFQNLTDWTPKPEPVNEIQWARRGWACEGREHVQCVLCRQKLDVKLNRKEVDGQDVWVFIASDIDDGLVATYVELIVTHHLEGCPWREMGCDASLLRISFGNPEASIAELATRYDELYQKADPSLESSLILPTSLDLDAILLSLPADLLSPAYPRPLTAKAATTATVPPSTPAEAASVPPPLQRPRNRVALSLALTGWQRPSERRSNSSQDIISCHTCLRHVGLWMFRPREVTTQGVTEIRPAPMLHFDPVQEHRPYCPWRSAAAQRPAVRIDEPDMAAWARLDQLLRNHASLRAALEPQRRSPATPLVQGARTAPNTPARPGSTIGLNGLASSPLPAVMAAGPDDEDVAARTAKDRAMFSRLRRIKSVFSIRSGSKLQRTVSSLDAPRPTV